MTELEVRSSPPAFLGQGTQIEQSRAVAEVQGAITVAKTFPRSDIAAQEKMRDSCKQLALAERAFFKFPRAGQTITGPSVHLARELARCWGNVQYGVIELHRDDDRGLSEMQAFAWDVESNMRATSTFMVPHKKDKRTGVEKITDMRDIYENNANNAARRLREMIFSVLPPWFTEEAKNLCRATVENGGGKPLSTRVTDAISFFRSLGVSEDRLVERVGKPTSKWDVHDVSDLSVIGKSIKDREITKDDAFPVASSGPVTVAEILGSQPELSEADVIDAARAKEPA